MSAPSYFAPYANFAERSEARAWQTGTHKDGTRTSCKAKIVVVDEGHGFDPGLLDGGATGGFGLISIHERALSCGVEFQIDSVPGCGTRVTL